jgi:hypothetical protein
MLKKTVTYEDYNGKTRTEDFYFNLTRTECAELLYGLGPGKDLEETFQILMDSKDIGKIIATIKEMLLKSYGVKSEDGRRFIKNDEIRTAFLENPAFDEIYMELATDSEKAADFFARIIPKQAIDNLGPNPKQTLIDQANKMMEGQSVHLVD